MADSDSEDELNFKVIQDDDQGPKETSLNNNSNWPYMYDSTEDKSMKYFNSTESGDDLNFEPLPPDVSRDEAVARYHELVDDAIKLKIDLKKEKNDAVARVEAQRENQNVITRLKRKNSVLEEELKVKDEKIKKLGVDSNDAIEGKPEGQQNGETFTLASEEVTCVQCDYYIKEIEKMKKDTSSDSKEIQGQQSENIEELKTLKQEIMQQQEHRDKSDNKLRELDEAVRNLNDQLTESHKKIEDLNVMIAEKEEKLKEVKKETSEAHDEVNKMTDQMKELNIEKESHEANLSVLEDKKNALDKNVTRLTTALQDERQKCGLLRRDEETKLKEEIVSLQEENERLKTDHIDALKKLQDEVISLKEDKVKQTDVYKEEIQKLQEQNVSVTAEKNKLESDNAEEIKVLNDQIVSLNKANDKLAESGNVKSEKMHDEVASLQELNRRQKETMDIEIKKLTEEISALKEEKEKEIKVLTNETKELKDKKCSLEEENCKLLTKRDTWENEKLTYLADIEKLNSDIKSVRDELDYTKDSYEKEKLLNSAQVRTLNSQVGDLRNDFLQTKGKLQSLTQQKITADQKLQTMCAQLQESTDNVDSLRAQLTESNSLTESLRTQLQKSKNLADSKKSSLEGEMKTLRNQVTTLVGELQEEKDSAHSVKVNYEQQKDRVRALGEVIQRKDHELQLQVEKDDELLATLNSELERERSGKAHLINEHEKFKVDYASLVKNYHSLAQEAKRKEKEQQEEKDYLTAQLVTAEESMEDRNTQISELKVQVVELSTQTDALKAEVAAQNTRATVYEEDFLAERNSREQAHDRCVQMEHIILELELKNKTLTEQMDEVSQGNFARMRERHGSTANLNPIHDRQELHPGPLGGTQGAVGGMDLLQQEPHDNMEFANEGEEQADDRIYSCPICQEEQPDQETLELHARECTAYAE